MAIMLLQLSLSITTVIQLTSSHTTVSRLGPSGKIIASHNISILETHWRRLCHMDSEALDNSYLFN